MRIMIILRYLSKSHEIVEKQEENDLVMLYVSPHHKFEHLSIKQEFDTPANLLENKTSQFYQMMKSHQD